MKKVILFPFAVIIGIIFAIIITAIYACEWLVQPDKDVFDDWYEKGSEVEIGNVHYHC